MFIEIAEDTPSQQQTALKPKQNSQQPATENDPNAAAIGASSQSPVGSANPQQSQNSLNNSQQHQMVSAISKTLNIHVRHGHFHFAPNCIFARQCILFDNLQKQQKMNPTTHKNIVFLPFVQQQRENRPCQQQVQKIASESMIPTYRSGTDSMHKSNQSGSNAKQQQQQQQNNSSSFSANAPKADNKNAVINESNQNQCNSPVKRRSISQIDVRHFIYFQPLRFIDYYVC